MLTAAMPLLRLRVPVQIKAGALPQGIVGPADEPVDDFYSYLIQTEGGIVGCAKSHLEAV